MIHDDLADFKAAAQGKALVGLDLGTKTIGVAVSDLLWTVASPLETIKRTKSVRDGNIELW